MIAPDEGETYPLFFSMLSGFFSSFGSFFRFKTGGPGSGCGARNFL
jgi:hypothetical protein